VASLRADSTVEELSAPSFSVVLREMREVLAVAVGAEATDAGATEEGGGDVLPAASGEGGQGAPGTRGEATHEKGDGQARWPSAGPRPPAGTARNAAADRLRLARVVLDAGFAADAARAAYEALAGTIAGMLEGPAPESHAALIAGVYRDLVPAGGLPIEAHAVLARLHDLGALARAGVPLDAALARSAVDEATSWVERLGGASLERAAER
jgi:hypothetical protein